MRRPGVPLRVPGVGLPIRWRLALMSFGLLALLLAALGAVVSWAEEHTLLADRAAELHREAWLTAGTLNGTVYSFAYPDKPLPARAKTPPLEADPILRTLGQRLTNPGTRVCIVWSDGRQTVVSADPTAEMSTVVPPAVYLGASITDQAFKSVPPGGWYTIAPDAQGESQLIVLLPVIDVAHHTTIALLQVGTPTAPMDAAVTTTRLVLAGGVAIALLIAAALTFPLMSAGLRPLVAMERASQRIAAGALSLRLDEPPTHDEIGRLARSFNSMVAQLDAAFSRQKQFVADVSHELRTPLTALSAGLEMLLLGADRGEIDVTRRLTRGLFAEVDRMRRLVEDLLMLTRLDEGAADLRTDPVAIGPLMREVCEQAQRLAHGQTIQCEIAPALPAIRADADRLRQVLLNLIDNALKYTPTSGQVTLIARRETSGAVLLQIKDTGQGIPAESLPHVFDRFYRVDPARARGSMHGGAGLGLSIARSLVEAQGGQIAIDSTVGQGTTITIRFPVPLNQPDKQANLIPVLTASESDVASSSPLP